MLDALSYLKAARAVGCRRRWRMDVAEIVAFRTTLTHASATVDDALVWQVLLDKLP